MKPTAPAGTTSLDGPSDRDLHAQAEGPSKLGRAALRGGMAIGLAQALKVVVQSASLILIARLLRPEDFGLMASLTPLLSLVGLFQDMGLQQALIQRERIDDEFVNRVFWSTAAVGTIAMVGVASLAPVVASFYGDSRLVAMTIASSATVLLGSLASTPLGLMHRDMKFPLVAVIEVVSSVAGFASALAAASAGLQYWTLVVAPLVTGLVTLLGAALLNGWKPRRPRRPLFVDRDARSFGANLTGFNFVNFFARNLDNILIGRHLGSAALGLYDRGYKLLVFPLQSVTAPLSRVAIPLLSRLQRDPARFRSAALRMIGQLSLITVPAMAALMVVPAEAVALLFGPRWQGVAPIVAWLSIGGLMQSVGSSTGWIFIAQGRTSTMFWWGTYSSATAILSFIVGLRWGATGVAAAYAISGYVLRLPVLFFVVDRVGPVRAKDLAAVQLPLLIAAGATFAVIDLVARDALAIGGAWLCAAALTVSYGLAVLALCVHEGGRSILADTRALLLRALPRGARRSEIEA